MSTSRRTDVFPRSDIIAWRRVAPWADDDDVEQDLVITLALFDIFGDAALREQLAFRGGTAIHKLHVPPAARYSEDIDLVQRVPEGIGGTLDQLRRVLGWLGRGRSEIGEHPKLTFRFETESGATRRLKLEINTHEHFGAVTSRLFAVSADPVSNAVAIPTYALDELLATKLRALYQRRKGRDLFDLWWAGERAAIDPERIISVLRTYLGQAGQPMIRRRELSANLAAKSNPGYLGEVRPLLRADVAFDGAVAMRWVEDTFLPLFPA